jgi:predicted nucleic acid-binding protein
LRRIVCDTGPLLHLQEAGALDLLRIAGSIHTTPSVLAELSGLDPAWRNSKPEWLEILEVKPPFEDEAFEWLRSGLLDLGEAEALALARQMQAEWFLTDDTAARVLARQTGLEVHGSLGVVLWAAATGHLDRAQAERALESLASSSLWLSRRVLGEARAALGQIFS